MAFDFSCVDLEALAAKPLKCTCEHGAKSYGLKQMILDLFRKGQVQSIQLGDQKWRLEQMRPLAREACASKGEG